MKTKTRLNKKTKGFTLVELLAVIVILAILLIIAIPSVINVMKTSKNKAMLTFAQKVMNEVEKDYTRKMTLGGLERPSQTVTYIYDITKDLGLNSVGSYYGVCLLNLYEDNTYSLEVYMFDEENYLSFSSYHEPGTDAPQLTLDNIISAKNITSFLPDGVSLKKLPLKEIYASANLHSLRNWTYDSFVDGESNTQLFCTNREHGSIYYDLSIHDYTGPAKTETLNVLLQNALASYITTQSIDSLSNCSK